MKSTTEIQLSENVIQAGAKKLLDELGHEMPEPVGFMGSEGKKY